MAKNDPKTTIGNPAAQALTPEPHDDDEGLIDQVSHLEQTPEEREEELIERENALAARESRLVAMEAKMMAALERMERAAAHAPSIEDEEQAPKKLYDDRGREIPQLDLTMSYGVVIGDADAGYVQNGHRFTKDRRYICEEPKGVGKPFNIKLLGLVKALSKAA